MMILNGDSGIYPSFYRLSMGFLAASRPLIPALLLAGGNCDHIGTLVLI